MGETEMDGPVPTEFPPHDAEYHCQVAPGESVPVTVSVEEPAEHKKEGDALIVEGDEGTGLTVIKTLLQLE